MQILEYGNSFNKGLVVAEPLPTSYGDQGYQSNDDITIGYQLQSIVNNSRPTPPNTLGLAKMAMNNSKFSKSDSDLLNIDCYKQDIEIAWSRSEKCLVYISYTDTMALWVRNWLKPLIESWKYSEVMLHEDDMIPGFTISGERQRLILQAHKVVLVVSRDYSESPWCLYELQHAIQQEPALCRGRIIPILVDGCHMLPSIVRGVVPLMENDRNFSIRLKRNIFMSQC